VKQRPQFAGWLRGMSLIVFLALPVLPAFAAGEDPLHDLLAAVENDDIAAVKSLLDRGMETDTVDEMGNTLLMRAARGGGVKMVEFLLDKGASVNARNAFSDTALMLAALNGRLEICKLLLDHGAEFDTGGWTPLIYASTRGHDDIVRLLLSMDCDIDSVSDNGTSALMMAAGEGHTSTVKLLLERKADVNLVNEAGLTAIGWAEKQQRSDIIEMLRAAGAKK
jgi:uncharacterized protein